ncbi:MAG: ATP-binding protein [Synergistaceae bacterium]|jgi:predicted ATPase|nr:ATP-binding protein [Synergistaceae bacterium]
MFNFSLLVEDFAKIRRAEIEPSRLTLFIGDNNSGKSYMTTLLYGLSSRPFFDLFMQYKDFISERFMPIIHDGLSGKTKRYRFGPDDFGLLERTVNGILAKGRETFIERLFNKKIPIGKLEIKFHPSSEIDLCFDTRPYDDKIHLSVETQPKTRGYPWQMNETHGFVDDGDRKTLAALLAHAITKALLAADRPAYLPASRTGFLLTYKSVVGDSIEKAFNSAGAEKAGGRSGKLTVPVIDFLKMLAAFSTAEESDYIDDRVRTLEFVEKKILNGKIAVDPTPVPDYTYLPRGLSESLPMFVSSGVVTESTPLWLALKRPEINCLMIEEPEMCLHPALQKEMARVLVKIANSHFPVIASTHSDIILQHVNNMIRLKKRPDREREQMLPKLEYGENDLLDSKNVHVYQFGTEEGRTTVTKIECDENGIGEGCL